ncbi:MAG: hypothetical protein IM613_20220 [Cytophagales bacterium]|nr:hypothetical protein [Cytophagales bacterium]
MIDKYKALMLSLIVLLTMSLVYQTFKLRPATCRHASRVTDTVLNVAGESFELMNYYAGKYINDLDLVECYSLMSNYSRNQIGTTKLLHFQSLYASDLYRSLGRKAGFVVTPVGLSKTGDSAIFKVVYRQVDFGWLVNNMFKYFKKPSSVDSVSWVQERAPFYLDTLQNARMVSKEQHYLITSDKTRRLFVSPADPDAYF